VVERGRYLAEPERGEGDVLDRRGHVPVSHERRRISLPLLPLASVMLWSRCTS
jgi:hypothetical protein